jgi:hypothetical protein
VLAVRSQPVPHFTSITSSTLFLVFAALTSLVVSGAVQQSVSDKGGVEAPIRQLLLDYTKALQELDAEAVKKVQPSIEVEALKKAFRDMRALEVELTDVRILSQSDAAARVSVRVTQTLMPKAGSKQTTAVTRVMRLRKNRGAWVIEAFER